MSKNRIRFIVIHCSATPEGVPYTGEDIRRWHKAKGWKQVGYHWFIDLDGKLEVLQSIDDDDYLTGLEIVNGCWGLNQSSLHVCYCGGTDADSKPKNTLNQPQRETLESLVKSIIRRYPTIKVVGHNQCIHPSRTPKACPSFRADSWAFRVGIKDENIERRDNIFTR